MAAEDTFNSIDAIVGDEGFRTETFVKYNSAITVGYDALKDPAGNIKTVDFLDDKADGTKGAFGLLTDAIMAYKTAVGQGVDDYEQEYMQVVNLLENAFKDRDSKETDFDKLRKKAKEGNITELLDILMGSHKNQKYRSKIEYDTRKVLPTETSRDDCKELLTYVRDTQHGYPWTDEKIEQMATDPNFVRRVIINMLLKKHYYSEGSRD